MYAAVKTSTHRVLRPSVAGGLLITAVVVSLAVFADAIAPGDPLQTTRDSLLTPRWGHILGTDGQGRDVFLGIVHGARTSMTVVAYVMVISTVMGLAVGVAAGYHGGVVDELLMRATDLIQSVPRLLVAVFCLGVFGSSLRNLILVLAMTSWMLLARVVRAEAYSLKHRDFIAAARAMGKPGWRIIASHVLPHTMPPALVIIAMTGSRVILLEATLSFLGLGDSRKISWGYMISSAQAFLSTHWWLSVVPGAAIALTIVAINVLADSLADALDHPERGVA